MTGLGHACWPRTRPLPELLGPLVLRTLLPAAVHTRGGLFPALDSPWPGVAPWARRQGRERPGARPETGREKQGQQQAVPGAPRSAETVQMSASGQRSLQ